MSCGQRQWKVWSQLQLLPGHALLTPTGAQQGWPSTAL
jgi:hypothetical protein